MRCSCRFGISPCYFRVGRVSAGRRTVVCIMTTSPRTPAEPHGAAGRPAEAVAGRDPAARLRRAGAARRRRRARGVPRRRTAPTSPRWSPRVAPASTPTLMAALPNLGAVVNFGVGYDTTDVDAAAARGVGVSNTPDVLTDCVADTAVGPDDRRDAPVLAPPTATCAPGSWPADGNYPLTRQVSNTPRRHHRTRSHRRRNRQAAQRLRLHDLLPQPQPRSPDSPYAYVDSPGRARARRRRAGRRRGRRQRHPAAGRRRRSSTRSGRAAT